MSTKKASLPARPSTESDKAMETNSSPLSNQSPLKAGERKAGPKTRVSIQYDVGFANSLYIRGKGASLSWEIGQPLTNTKADEWVWETSSTFTTCEFKILINDTDYEIGDNHLLTCGASIHYTPKFH